MAENTASKVAEIEDARQAEELFAGQLGVSSLHALTGHRGLGGKELGGVFNGGLYLLGQGGTGAQDAVLVAAAQLKYQGIEGGGVVLQLLRALAQMSSSFSRSRLASMTQPCSYPFAGGYPGGGTSIRRANRATSSSSISSICCL
ncbi:MAG: hypothetical protein V8T45_00465 [Oscillospiraceae bacterium]